MSTSSDGVEVDDSWRVDLEIALLEDADFFRIRTICANRPVPANTRAEVWRICLQPELQGQGMTGFRNVFELENQHELHIDCKRAAQEAVEFLSSQSSEHTACLKLCESDDDGDNVQGSPLADEDKFDFGRETEPDQPHGIPSVIQLTSDFESVITHFTETYSLIYTSDNGWVSILKLLYCTLKPVDKHDLYACFSSVYHRFIPNGPDVDHRMCHVFRLLFQYHEPELCNLLESLKITPNLYAKYWLFSLFANTISHAALVALWDVYFLISDPLLGLYIVLVLLINAKPSLMDTNDLGLISDGVSCSLDEVSERKSTKTFDKNTVLQTLLDLPKPMEANDVTSLIELTQLFSSRTPSSFRSEFSSFLFGNTVLDAEDGPSMPPVGHLCLPVTVQEVLEAQAASLKYSNGTAADVPNEFKPSVRFLLVDCRPADQYNSGHLNTAFFIDSQLLLSDPNSFQSTVEALLQSQKRALNAGSHAAGEHITFLSSGRPEEDQITNMVVAAFLRLNTPYVSLIKGGYVALHETLGPQQIGRSLVSHNSRECLCCQNQPLKKDSVAGLFESDSKNIKKDISTTKQPLPSMSTSKSMSGFFSKLSSSIFKSANTIEPQRVPVSTRQARDTINTTDKTTLTNTTTRPEVRGAVTGVKLSQAQHERPASYRNTASVFSIDEEEDVDDLSISDSGLVTSVRDDTAESPTQKNPVESRNVSWLRRLTAAIHVVETDLPKGDIPSRSGGLDDSEPGDLIDTTQWSSRSELHGVFDCQLIDTRGRLSDSGYLVLAERHLLVLRDHSPRSPARLIASIGSAVQSAFARTSSSGVDSAKITARARHAVVLRSAPLALITRITANRRLPECITFHYSGKDPTDLLQLNEPVMGIRDRLYLPQAGEAVRMIKLAICHVTMA